jgi:hypothetical protein
MAPPAPCQCQWGEIKHPISLKRASIVSVDSESILSDTPDGVFGASKYFRAKGATSPLVIEPGEDRAVGSPCDEADFPFLQIRDKKYFFDDGNVTFLVCDLGDGHDTCISDSETGS